MCMFWGFVSFLWHYYHFICCRIVRSPISDLLSQKESPEQNRPHDDVCNVEIESNVSSTSLILWSVLSYCLNTSSEDMMLQDQMCASVSMEEISHSSENGISDLGAENTENTTIPAIKACKATKAGEKASQEIIGLWKENGFSRYLKLNIWLIIQRFIKLRVFLFYFICTA